MDNLAMQMRATGEHLLGEEYSEEEIIRFNDAADVYFQSIKDPSFVLNKPLSGIFEAPWLLFKFSILLAGLDIGIGHTVLDFGAGTCWTSSMLNRMGCRTIALDVSETALKLGRRLFEYDRRQRLELDPQFLVYDGFTFPLNPETVDRVFCLDAFHHVPNKQAILNEMFRVLKWGGRVGLSEPGAHHSRSPSSILEAETYHVLESDIEIEDVIKMGIAAGFQEVRVKPYPLPESIDLGIDEYRQFIKGDDAAFPLQAIRKDSQSHTHVILIKGQGVADSRKPHILTALLTVVEGQTRGLTPGEKYTFDLVVKNLGDTIWRASPNRVGGFVTLGAHLLDARNNLLELDYGRAALINDINPGEEEKISIVVIAPKERGKYIVEFDMVCEKVCWFERRGSPTRRIEIEVT